MSCKKEPETAVEFPRPVVASKIGAGVKRYKIEATREERAALAERFRILSVESLVADIELSARQRGALVFLKGSLTADVTQSCVVSLAPAPDHIEESFSLVYSAETRDSGRDVELFLDESDPPEPIIDDVIDIGEATAEHLALALDPFPRLKDARFQDIVEDDGEEEAAPLRKKGAFDALAALKKK